MISRLLAALRVFVASMLGVEPAVEFPEPIPVVPTLAQRFGQPYPPPRLEIESPHIPREIVRRLATAVGESFVEATPAQAGKGAIADDLGLRVRLAGRYKLPGPFQRQILNGGIVAGPPTSRLTLFLTARGASSGVSQIAATMAFAAFVAFVFLTWITGPTDVSLIVIGLISVLIGVAVGALIQGFLNQRGNLKERRRLSETAARLATLLGGKVVKWP